MAMLSFRNSSVLSRFVARGGTLALLGLLGAILAACGPGGAHVGY
jgi:hypothetical protein